MALARARATDQRFYGLCEGEVVDVEDPLGEGRVRVRFQWFDGSLETEWCRVCQLYAGNGFGSVFVPEVGTEVFCGFIMGDMRFPVILGGAYNGPDQPPSARSSNVDQKMIRTKGGHEILFDDTSGKERVRVKTNGGESIDLSDADKTIVVDTGQGQKLAFDQQGNSIKLETTGGQSIELDGSGGITITGPTSVKLSGSSIDLGDAAVHPLILSRLFMILFNAHTHTVFGVPTTPPITPMTDAMLSTVVKTI